MSEVLFPGGREDSIVTDPDKPGGKDVLAEPAQELRSFEVHDLLLVVAVVAPPEGYSCICFDGCVIIRLESMSASFR